MQLQKAFICTASIIFGILFAAAAVHAQAMKITTAEVAYDKGNAKVKGYLAKPADKKARPGLILIHEWWGLNDNIRENARAFAELGYVALAVDLYDGEMATTPDGARKLAGGVRKNTEAAFANLKQAMSYLSGLTGEVDPARIASVGWCFGGGWSYQMAKNDLGVKASVIYYGRFNPADDLSRMRATILGHFGETDRGIKVDNVREFQAKLKTLKGDHMVFIYPNAGHAFANADSRNYDKAASEAAWKRTREFFQKHL
ncbi:MAG: dienelactone hydrolase family protein [Deltaproteobacteria bacterium]|nr:dienelactone hydrolase family protein [Deltaproteobacteria bacterium]